MPSADSRLMPARVLLYRACPGAGRDQARGVRGVHDRGDPGPDQDLRARSRLEPPAPGVRARLRSECAQCAARLLRHAARQRQAQRPCTRPRLRLCVDHVSAERPGHPGGDRRCPRSDDGVRSNRPAGAAQLSGRRIRRQPRRHAPRRAISRSLRRGVCHVRPHRQLPARDQLPGRLPRAVRLLLPRRLQGHGRGLDAGGHPELSEPRRTHQGARGAWSRTRRKHSSC